MADNREVRRLKAEIDRLRAKLHAAHDLLHNDRLNELHELLHCDSAADGSAPLPGQNVSIDAASRLHRFVTEFNGLCGQHRINACSVAFIPSAVKQGYVSIQLGGSVEVMNYVRQQMGMAPTIAVGDHDH